ncbi:MAG: hypothetical protein ACI9G1_001136 [Pirellulaceae bacterium]|jgi:uncharacterized protein (DUF1499 family)
MTEQQAVSVKKSRRQSMIYLAIAIAVLALFVCILPMLYVEDWSRDLSTNFAETSENAEDPRQRPIVTSRSPEEVVAAIKKFAANRSGWEVAEIKTAPPQTLHLIRTSALVGYKDDVKVTISSRDENRIAVEAQSQSRIGKGDFGQNPRNLRELLQAIRTELTSSSD